MSEPGQAESRLITTMKSGQRGFEHADGRPPMRGIADLVAYALVTLDLKVVRRATIQSLFPSGRGTHYQTGEPTRPIREYVRTAIRKFDQCGWVAREGHFVRILNRDALRQWVGLGVDFESDSRTLSLLDIEEAARRINADIASGAVVSGWDAEMIRRDAEVRRHELIALKRLMESTPTGGNPGGRGSVRVVPAGRVL